MAAAVPFFVWAAAATLCLLVVGSVPVSAEISLLPAYGRVLLDVEAVCNHSNRVFVRSAMVSGDINAESPYPFYIERLYDDALVRTLVKSSGEMYISTDAGSCTTVTSGIESNDNVRFWNLLRELLTKVYASSAVEAEPVVYRSIESYKSVAKAATLTVPVDFGGSGTARSFTVDYLTSSREWSLNSQRNLVHSPLTVSLFSGAEETCTLTFSYFGGNVTSDEDYTKGCDASSSSAASSSAALRRAKAAALASKARRAAESSLVGSDSGAPALPPLPDLFSANFQTIDPRGKAIYHMRNSFDLYGQTCHTTLQSIHPDTVGRVSFYEWYVQGQSQLTYFHESKAVLSGTEVIDEAVQNYFWPNTDSCDRALIGYDLFSNSAESFLMVSALVPPMFVGNRSVRGIPCGVWSAPVDGARVSWYFASDPSSFSGAYNTADSEEEDEANRYSRLVRITVEGFGDAAPFFVHHPFFAQGYAFPKQDRRVACFELTPDFFPEGCSHMPDEVFFFNYDVTSFVPYVPYDNTETPFACAHTLTGAAFPSATCRFQGGIPAGVSAVLMVLVALLFLFLGSCCMWCRFAPMVRGLQEDMITLIEELDRRGEAANEGEGAARADNHAAGSW